MLGDVLLIQEMHKLAAADIANHVKKQWDEKQDGYRFIVGISGESGAGKSELAHSLALELKKHEIRVKILHTDNYYKVAPRQRMAWRMKTNMELIGYEEYDWDLIDKNIDDFKQGLESVMPCIDIVSEQIDKQVTNFREIEILVIDGLYAIKTSRVDLRVFIELTYHETKIAQISRGKEPINETRMKILAREHLGVQALRPLADLLVNKNYQVVEAD